MSGFKALNKVFQVTHEILFGNGWQIKATEKKIMNVSLAEFLAMTTLLK